MKRPNRPKPQSRPGPRALPSGQGRPRRAPGGQAPRATGAGSGPSTIRQDRRATPADAARAALHVAPVEVLAATAVAVARDVERGVLAEQKRADRLLAAALRGPPHLAPPDRRVLHRGGLPPFPLGGWGGAPRGAPPPGPAAPRPGPRAAPRPPRP